MKTNKIRRTERNVIDSTAMITMAIEKCANGQQLHTCQKIKQLAWTFKYKNLLPRIRQYS